MAETAHWLVLLRPQQPTLGSLVLVCKEAAEAFSELTPGAFADLKTAVDGVERLLTGFVGYARINYLMLMMVDRDVHFHVIPRYEGGREHAGVTYADAGWPAQPNLSAHVALDDAQSDALAKELAGRWFTA